MDCFEKSSEILVGAHVGEGLVRLLCSESFDIDTVTDKVYYKQRQNNKTTNIFKLKVKKVINLYMSAGYSDYAIQFLLKTSSLVHELGNDQQAVNLLEIAINIAQVY